MPESFFAQYYFENQKVSAGTVEKTNQESMTGIKQDDLHKTVK
jgi:hypothetical protein